MHNNNAKQTHTVRRTRMHNILPVYPKHKSLYHVQSISCEPEINIRTV